MMRNNTLTTTGLNQRPRPSQHFEQRAQQRGLRCKDMEVICRVGEEFGDGYYMSGRAVGERIRKLKAEIQQLERLRGVVVIEQQDTYVTTYRADKRRSKRIMKYGKSKNCVKKETLDA
jgi:hypothetical protein